MKKKIVSFMCVAFFLSFFSMPSYAASGLCSVTSSLPMNYTLPLKANSTEEISFSLNTASYAGYLIEIPLLGDLASGDTRGVAYVDLKEGITWAVKDVVDGEGLPVPFWVNGNSLVVVPNNTGVSYISFNLSISTDTLYSGALDGTIGNNVCVNGNVEIMVHGQASAMSLAKFLNAFHLQLDHITNNTADIERYGEVMSYYITYLESIDIRTGEMNSNLSQLISSLNWIVSEMEGNVVGILMGDYAGYNYSQLLVEVIRSIQNISFGDIGDVTVQTDLTEVLTLLTNIFNSLDNLEDIEDKTAYLSEQLTLLITYLQDNTETLQSIGLDVQALLDLLASEEFLGYIEDRLDEMVEEQKLTNKTLQDILAALEDIRRSLIYGGGSGGGGGSATGNLFFEVLDGVLSGVFQLLSNLLGIVFKAVFGLFKWVTQFVGWINTDYLGGFFPAPIWTVVSVIIPLIVVLGLIRFVRGFL